MSCTTYVWQDCLLLLVQGTFPLHKQKIDAAIVSQYWNLLTQVVCTALPACTTARHNAQHQMNGQASRFLRL